jgi:5-methylcytosine-specific restriction endonuclease McrA
MRRPSTPLSRRRVRKSALVYRRALKHEMIAAYGGACTCCSETIREFLSLEHLAGDGAAHRAAVGRNAQAQLLDLKRRGWPQDNYTVLCMNCNLAKGVYGTCPHTWPEYKAQEASNE